jgi:hypothetical protein
MVTVTRSKELEEFARSRFTFDDGCWVASRVVNVVVRDPDDGEWKWVLTASQALVPNELLLPGSPLGSPV